MSTWKEPEKEIPVVYDVDVAVAGAGVSGVHAALAAAKSGADTVLIDRFNAPGGIHGPGWRPPGGRAHMAGRGATFPTGFVGIPLEVVKRLEALGFGKDGSSLYTPKNWMTESFAASYILLKVLEEAGVKLLLSTWVSDPMLEGGVVKGVLVENKSGRRAVKAKVTVDATGEADLARRAGASIIYPEARYHEMDLHAPTGIGNQFAVCGVDCEKYEAFLAEQDNPEDLFKKDKADPNPIHIPPPRWTYDGIAFGMTGRKPDQEPGVDAGDGLQISGLDVDFHISIFEKVEHWKKNLPGFEKAAVLAVTPFLGARGGPCIEGEYVVTLDDVLEGREFPDNLFVYRFRPPRLDGTKPDYKWMEVPYRCMVPKNLDGLLCTGRSASSIPDTMLRERVMIGHMGQAAGTAAAMAAEQNIAPRQLDVRPLQKNLLEAGFYLGEPKRLKELGLV